MKRIRCGVCGEVYDADNTTGDHCHQITSISWWKSEVARLREYIDGQREQLTQATAALAEKEAENEKLREELELAAALCEGVAKSARAALVPSPTKESSDD